MPNILFYCSSSKSQPSLMLCRIPMASKIVPFNLHAIFTPKLSNNANILSWKPLAIVDSHFLPSFLHRLHIPPPPINLLPPDANVMRLVYSLYSSFDRLAYNPLFQHENKKYVLVIIIIINNNNIFFFLLYFVHLYFSGLFFPH